MNNLGRKWKRSSIRLRIERYNNICQNQWKKTLILSQNLYFVGYAIFSETSSWVWPFQREVHMYDGTVLSIFGWHPLNFFVFFFQELLKTTVFRWKSLIPKKSLWCFILTKLSGGFQYQRKASTVKKNIECSRCFVMRVRVERVGKSLISKNRYEFYMASYLLRSKMASSHTELLSV